MADAQQGGMLFAPPLAFHRGLGMGMRGFRLALAGWLQPETDTLRFLLSEKTDDANPLGSTVPDDAATSVVANKLGWFADWVFHNSRKPTNPLAGSMLLKPFETSNRMSGRTA